MISLSLTFALTAILTLTGLGLVLLFSRDQRIAEKE
jgi:hypothetical protein